MSRERRNRKDRGKTQDSRKKGRNRGRNTNDRNNRRSPVEVRPMPTEPLIGVLQRSLRRQVVVVESKQYDGMIFIPENSLNGAVAGDKVVVKITDFKKGARMPWGEIIEVLGPVGDNETEMHAILSEFGLPYHYPKNLEEEADKLDAFISEREIKKRLDYRQKTTFTIDPEDAKDFDDALSLEKTQDNCFEVGVHIADVTHYVTIGSDIDKEAYRRGTSVYLVDRTIPMLPEKLSNEICSLRPDEDKLCYSVIFLLDANAKVLKHTIKHTVIRSNRRFTYEEAQKRIDTGEGDYADELQTLNMLAQKLRAERQKNGAIDFDKEEMRFHIDSEGKPTDVYIKHSGEANWLIEEFMLLANRTVAETIGKRGALKTLTEEKPPFVYRVHDVPDPDKMLSTSKFISQFGYNLKVAKRRSVMNKSINNVLEMSKEKPERNIVELLILRSMAKAVYSTDNIGHYGLGFTYYTHFTSPIRRYPDMMVHRLLDRYLEGKRNTEKTALQERCDHCSEREQLAANAERASVKYKQVEFMQERLGQVFTGIVTGVTEWGLFVELDDNHCEGMLAIRNLLPQDYYVYSEEEYMIKGERTNTRYRLGDKLRVKVAKADLARKQLDFVLDETDN